MLEKKITYTDYNGIERTENFYFNLSKSELIELQASVDGGLDGYLTKIASRLDAPKIMKFFRDLILRSYGEKSDDGRRFIKSKELSAAFSQTEAYDKLFVSLVTDADAGVEFINGIMPKDLSDKANAASANLAVVKPE